MKAAVLLQGDPRFCVEFDRFLENLKGFDQVDYFMYMWEDNTPTESTAAGGGFEVVAPAWQRINRDWALSKFQEFFPEGHRVVSLELGNQNNIPTTDITENVCPTARPKNMWKMWYSLYTANQTRLKYETEHNFKYDIVVRTRPDVALLDVVNAEAIKNKLDNEPNVVIMPNNKRCGHQGIWICDLFGMGTSDTMTKYCDLYNQALDHHKEGTIFHPETMLGKHLQKNDCRFDGLGFSIEFRHMGKWRDITTGEEWPANNVPGWDNKIYISDFGRWA